MSLHTLCTLYQYQTSLVHMEVHLLQYIHQVYTIMLTTTVCSELMGSNVTETVATSKHSCLLWYCYTLLFSFNTPVNLYVHLVGHAECWFLQYYANFEHAFIPYPHFQVPTSSYSGRRLTKLNGCIEFSDVRFSYPARKDVQVRPTLRHNL